MSAKKILVTGGAGAIGSNLIKALLARGCEVVVLDDLSSGHASNLPQSPQVTFHNGSVVEEANLAEVFCQRYDVVFHLAALFANQNSVEHPQQDLLVNALGTLNVLEWSTTTGAGRVVFSSSSCVYGGALGALHEDQPRNFRETPYGISKAFGEDYVHFYYEHHHMPITILRYFNTYGPGEYPGRYRNVIPNFFARAMLGKPLIITGTGDETRDFTYVTDTVEGTIRAAEVQAANGQVINLGRGQETTIREIAERINAMVGNKAGIEYKPRRNWDHVSRRRASIDRAQRLLNYDPAVPLEKGLELTYAWLRQSWKPDASECP